MSHQGDCILQVAVPSPLRRLFDYLPPDKSSAHRIKPGVRVRVPFGRRSVIGVVAAVGNTSEVPVHKLKKVSEILDQQPLFDLQHMGFLRWSADYYQHPVGEVLVNALPGLLRQGKPDQLAKTTVWKVTNEGMDYPAQDLARSPRQRALLELLQACPEGLSPGQIDEQSVYSRPALNALQDKELVKEATAMSAPVQDKTSEKEISLSREQTSAVASITASLDRYNCFLLNGVTGSGKTEIYIRAIRKVIENGRQVLILVPEIGLTPQFVHRLADGVHAEVALYHSGLSNRERLNTWLRARDHQVSVILGTRSAVWIPLKAPGLFIVDEEHDLSFKQQEGFRYSARDLTLVRAHNSHCPVVLGSATPSLESLHNRSRRDYQQILLTQRVADANLPEIRVLDMKTSVLNGALSESLHRQIAMTLEKQQQVLIFQNRRGYAPACMCHHCGWLAGCDRCDKLMTLHKQKALLWCHHCDRQTRVFDRCPDCGHTELIEVGHGTERIEEDLASAFPKARIVRIDRDTTRRKGSMDRMYHRILSGEADILVGTQMLAKGHHFPAVTLAAIVDIDSSLYSSDFRAVERMGQLVTQVSGRAGRGEHPGTVVIQTHFPEHPLLKTLLREGYMAFASRLLDERRDGNLPPWAFMVLLRAEANRVQETQDFLENAGALLPRSHDDLSIIGPIFAPMERKAGRYRMQLLLQSANRQTLNRVLQSWCQQLEGLKSARRVRWSIDVDPQDMM